MTQAMAVGMLDGLGLLAWPEALELLAGLDWAGSSTKMLRSHDAYEISAPTGPNFMGSST
jgi:hypothetical protein